MGRLMDDKDTLQKTSFLTHRKHGERPEPWKCAIVYVLTTKTPVFRNIFRKPVFDTTEAERAARAREMSHRVRFGDQKTPVFETLFRKPVFDTPVAERAARDREMSHRVRFGDQNASARRTGARKEQELEAQRRL